MSDKLSHEFDCDLVIGLVAAVGTELGSVTRILDEQLKLAGYEPEVIRVSRDVIPKMTSVPEGIGSYQEPGTHFEKYSKLMTAGNKAREAACGSGSQFSRDGNAALAYGVAAEVFAKRQTDENGQTLPAGKRAFIVRSLKRPEEVEALRLIYPQGFVLIGVHAEEQRRKRHLVDDLGMTGEEAGKLIDRDEDESKTPHGQRVNQTFHLADFFAHDSGNTDHLRQEMKRMVELWFGAPFHTPRFDEYAMFFAFSAALRSADLSRQVGAVVAREDQILSTGANECPKANGGLYWPSESNEPITDHPQRKGRDHEIGVDSNRKEQLRIIDDICASNAEGGYGFDEERLRELLQKSGITDLTEYGRVVHAEMEALLACGRIGISTKDAELYCTTFPCHNCAKHLIAAGIRRVVFIEPYAKSKALDFHQDSIASGVEPDHNQIKERVRFEPFVGIGPRRFFDLFSMNLGSSYELKRKNDDSGEKVDWCIGKARLRIQMKPLSYLDLEKLAVSRYKAFSSSSTDGAQSE